MLTPEALRIQPALFPQTFSTMSTADVNMQWVEVVTEARRCRCAGGVRRHMRAGSLTTLPVTPDVLHENAALHNTLRQEACTFQWMPPIPFSFVVLTPNPLSPPFDTCANATAQAAGDPGAGGPLGRAAAPLLHKPHV